MTEKFLLLDTLEKIRCRDQFLEIDFQRKPFQLISNENENLSNKYDYIIANIDNKDPNISKEINNYIQKKDDDSFIEIKYKNVIKTIYRHPIRFKLLSDNENEIAFSVYEINQFKKVLSRLKIYYFFLIKNEFVFSNDIIKLQENNQLKCNEIILIPKIFELFSKFKIDNELEDKINNTENFYFEIEKEQLEPYSLYIEKKEIIEKASLEKPENFDNNLLKRKLIFIMNNKRKKFIKALNDYIKIDIQTEPMMIIGNDGVGKSLTLQLYTLLEFKGYKKLYFNLKLLKKCNIRDYIFIELIRGFVSKDEEKDLENLKNYLNCVKLYQKKKVEIEEFFNVLIDILNYLENFEEKFLIIFDQFDFEAISSKKFKDLREKIGSYEQFKLIICCSLIDNENKKNLFSNYKNINLDKYTDNVIEFPFKKNIHPKKIDKIQKYDKGTKLSNFNFIIEMNQKKNERNIEENKFELNNNNNIFNLFKTSKEEENNKEEKEFLKKNDNKNNLLSVYHNAEDKAQIEEDKVQKNENKYKNILHKLKNHYYKYPIEHDDTTSSNDKLKIYYSNLISMEEMIQDKEIKECMSNFNYIPKYSYKFNLFQVIKELKGEKNLSNIIDEFYETEEKNIINNINSFYTKLLLMEISQKNEDSYKLNTYKYLLKLKKTINKTYEHSIPFYKLYNYSLIFPFKYINIITEENEQIDIIFDEKLRKKKFKLRYSFPLLEDIIEKMLKGFNDDKLDISSLSGSAFGNAMEIKIRENLNLFNEKIDFRAVWALNPISQNVKREKLNEIKRNKNSSKRYQNLEDITQIKDIIYSNYNYFYFKPENQDNKYFDSLFIIKKDKEFSIVAFQITKNRLKKNVQSKETYSEFLIKKVKSKFEDLYKISISRIFFWYILDPETKDNESLCKILNDRNIMYAFYSIKKKCFYVKRDDIMIKTVNYFNNAKSMIYQLNGISNIKNNYYEIYNYDTSPPMIKIFEQTLFDDYIKDNNIYFEMTRYLFFRDNFGPKINDNLKKNLINTLKNYLTYSNEFEVMFLFASDLRYLIDFQSLNLKDLIYLLKIKDKIYFLFEKQFFEIVNEQSLIKCNNPQIDLINIAKSTKYHTEEFDFSLIDDIYKNRIIYLYKIYYLGKELIKKNN